MKNVLSLFLVLAAIGIFFGYVKPQWAELSVQRQELKVYNDTLLQAEQLEKQIAGLQTQVAAINPNDMEKLVKMVPSSASDVKIILAMEDVASFYGLQMKGIQLKEDDAASTGRDSAYNSVDISFNVTAEYPTFMNFLAGLENNLRIMDVVSVSFAPGDKAAYDFAVTVRTYWLK